MNTLSSRSVRISGEDAEIKLATEGPVKQEPAKRRVRALVSGQWVVDTLEAQYVWERPYYPEIYIPLDAVEAGGCKVNKLGRRDQGYWVGALGTPKEYASITGFEQGPLQGLAKIYGSNVEWFAEDEKVLGPHPKDPYKRIECLRSSREVRIDVDGTTVALSTNNVFLYETLLRTRYYLPATAVKDWGMLAPSDTTTFCPYKGQASYYHLRLGDREIKDAVWCYRYPTLESAAVQGLLCFYNEKVEVYVEGVREEK